jgi:hypothetical protein
MKTDPFIRQILKLRQAGFDREIIAGLIARGRPITVKKAEILQNELEGESR